MDSISALPRERLLLDPGWKFHRGDIVVVRENAHAADYFAVKTGAAKGAASSEYDDHDWRLVDLPHDFIVEGTFSPEADLDHGFLPFEVGWYRKSFILPAADKGRRLGLEFDGVFRKATVWLNGHRLGQHPSGYIGFRYEITDQANFGGENILAVRADATQIEGWWYEGGGLYRHVWLVKTGKLSVAPWGVFVSADLNEDFSLAQVTIQTELENEDDALMKAEVLSAILDHDGHQVAFVSASEMVPAGGSVTVRQQTTITNPALWSVEQPALYRLVTTVKQAGETVDICETTFGVRSLRFDADQGFFLNGQPLKLQGACNHQDHAGVGVALPDAVLEYRIRRLKEMGCNAYRCAHNPPASELLDACDRLGMLVMDENRYLDANPERLRDLRDMIRRDRNHPSVIMWSMGNEEPIQGSTAGARIIRRMVRLVKQLDPTRPAICALSGDWNQEDFVTATDLMGCNYNPGRYDTYHQKYPTLPMVGSETGSTVSTRGIYADDPERCYLSAYDRSPLPWATMAEPGWKAIAERPFMAGLFVWTGFDYRGEPSPFGWPCINSHFGLMDTCGFPKDNAYYYQSWWTKEPVLHLLPHWTWPGRAGEAIEVWVHSNCERVELFLNDESLGAQNMEKNGHLEWKVKYAPGTLLARGYRGGQEVATDRVETTGGPVAFALSPDRHTLRADGEDVAVVTVGILDAEGRLVPTADSEVRFAVTGGARIIGVGNGNPSSHEPDQANRRRAFNGLCQVLVQMGRESGEVSLTASSPGLLTETLTLTAEPCQPRPYLGFLDKAQSLITWRRSPLLTEEPGGDTAPQDWDQNLWEHILLGSGGEGKAGVGWVVYRTAVGTPSYDGQQETLSLKLEGLTLPTKVYINGLLAGSAESGGLTVPVTVTPGAPLTITLVVRQEGTGGDPARAVFFERQAKK